MKAIWKYTLQGPCTSLEMPLGAKILSLHVQGNVPQIWALVDPSQPRELRTFMAFPTGEEFSIAGRCYVGTFLINGDSLVFHIFEEMA